MERQNKGSGFGIDWLMKIELHEGVYVLRDDVLPGGTKSVILPHLIKGPAREFVYCSPVYGGFQIALAEYCAAKGLKATIFCAERKVLHANTVRVKAAGANVVQVRAGYLSVLEARAKLYCAERGAVKLPFGAHTPEAVSVIAARMRRVTALIGREPDDVWCAVGSGTLIEGILEGTDAAAVHGVMVGKGYNSMHPRARLMKHPQEFSSECRTLAPFPSMPNYDLKAWQFCRQYKSKGIVLFWNVL